MCPVSLQVHGGPDGDCDELRLLSDNETFLNLRGYGGSLSFNETKVSLRGIKDDFTEMSKVMGLINTVSDPHGGARLSLGRMLKRCPDVRQPPMSNNG